MGDALDGNRCKLRHKPSKRMPQVGFETTTQVFAQPETNALQRSATVIGGLLRSHVYTQCILNMNVIRNSGRAGYVNAAFTLQYRRKYSTVKNKTTSLQTRTTFRRCVLPPSSGMEAVRTSETSVDNHFTRQYIPENNSEQKLSKSLYLIMTLYNLWELLVAMLYKSLQPYVTILENVNTTLSSSSL